MCIRDRCRLARRDAAASAGWPAARRARPDRRAAQPVGVPAGHRAAERARQYRRVGQSFSDVLSAGLTRHTPVEASRRKRLSRDSKSQLTRTSARLTIEFAEPVEDDVQLVGAALVLDHDEAQIVVCDVVVGDRHTCRIGVSAVEELTRCRQVLLPASSSTRRPSSRAHCDRRSRGRWDSRPAACRPAWIASSGESDCRMGAATTHSPRTRSRRTPAICRRGGTFKPISTGRQTFSACEVGAIGEPSLRKRAVNPCRSLQFYSFRRYASSATRSSGTNGRSKCTPSVERRGGTTPGGATTFARLNTSV